MEIEMEISKLDFDKGNGLLPAVIQHWKNGEVLMLGYMNREACEKTQKLGRVTFYSRTKERLWTKGETSGNYLELVDWQRDCDNDTLLILARPHGPTCHTGNKSCFYRKDFAFEQSNGIESIAFIEQLEKVIQGRKSEMPKGSYTTSLFEKGVDKIAQKVGEEAIETVIAAKNDSDEEFKYEVSDLVYHLIVLLTERNITLEDIAKELESRHS